MNALLRPSFAWLLAALVFVLPAGAVEEAPGLADALKRFRDVPPPASVASPGDENTNMRDMGAHLRSWNEAQNQLGNLQGYFDGNDYAGAVRQARQYGAAARTPEIRKLWDDLVAALQAQSLQQSEAYIAQVNEVCERHGKTALAAAKAGDLDPLLENVAEMREARGNRSLANTPRVQRATQRLDGLNQFLSNWQDYLLFLENGETESARTVLRTLIAQSQRNSPVPRSELITRLAGLKSPGQSAAEDILKDATLDNLAEIRERVLLSQEAGGRRTEFSYNFVSELERLISATAALKNGRADVGRLILRNTNPNSQQWDSVSRLRDDWYLRALPVLTGLTSTDKPAAGETAAAFIKRQFEAEVARENWPVAQALATVQRDFIPEFVDVRASTAALDNPAVAINAWIKGRLMEKASQPLHAAALYREALKAGAPPVLEARLIDRLRALANEFPDSASDAR